MKAESLDTAEKSDISFFAVREPGQGNNFISGGSTELISGLHEGFVIKPFDPKSEPITIPSDFSLDSIPEKYLADTELSEESFLFTSESQYRMSVANTIDSIIQSETLEKVVISRIERIERKFKLSDLFVMLADEYPDAYIFCFRTPGTGLWIGASPELLLKKSDREISTMSLAGTRKIEENGCWSKKNIREQQIVTESIVNQMKDFGYYPVISPVTTRKAGPVEHLCTRITAYTDNSMSASQLALRLSPTPALGGYPSPEALKVISENENHQRSVYGGFSGLVSANGDFSFYVSLRCMKVCKSAAYLYIGGGITSESKVDEEWIETIEKSRTLLEIISDAEKRIP